MIDIVNEQMIPLAKIPAWCEKQLGNRVHPSTVHVGDCVVPGEVSWKPS